MAALLALGALEGMDAYGVAAVGVCHGRASRLTNTALACLFAEVQMPSRHSHAGYITLKVPILALDSTFVQGSSANFEAQKSPHWAGKGRSNLE